METAPSSVTENQKILRLPMKPELSVIMTVDKESRSLSENLNNLRRYLHEYLTNRNQGKAVVV